MVPERPFVIINVAVTVDGKMDTFERKGATISSLADKQRVKKLRAQSDAVMVGGHTLLDEDPKLTVKDPSQRAERLAKGLSENPIKVGVVTIANLKLDGDFMTAGPSRRVIFTTTQTSAEQVRLLTNQGAEVYMHESDRVLLPQALGTLHELGVSHLMVEGGGNLNFELLRQGLVDELFLYLAPKIFGGQNAPTLAEGTGLVAASALNLKLLDASPLEDDGGILIHYRLLS